MKISTFTIFFSTSGSSSSVCSDVFKRHSGGKNSAWAWTAVSKAPPKLFSPPFYMHFRLTQIQIMQFQTLRKFWKSDDCRITFWKSYDCRITFWKSDDCRITFWKSDDCRITFWKSDECRITFWKSDDCRITFWSARNETNVEKEYCWAITQKTARSCCCRSGSVVLDFWISFGTAFCIRIRTRILEHKNTQFSAGYLRLQIHTLRLCNAHCSSSTTMVARTRLNLLKPAGHMMHQQFNIRQLYALPTLCLCVLYLSENKQILVPLTAWTDWFL